MAYVFFNVKLESGLMRDQCLQAGDYDFHPAVEPLHSMSLGSYRDVERAFDVRILSSSPWVRFERPRRRRQRSRGRAAAAVERARRRRRAAAARRRPRQARRAARGLRRQAQPVRDRAGREAMGAVLAPAPVRLLRPKLPPEHRHAVQHGVDQKRDAVRGPGDPGHRLLLGQRLLSGPVHRAPLCERVPDVHRRVRADDEGALPVVRARQWQGGCRGGDEPEAVAGLREHDHGVESVQELPEHDAGASAERQRVEVLVWQVPGAVVLVSRDEGEGRRVRARFLPRPDPLLQFPEPGCAR
ncbi:hypothetical protein KL946_005295 [Ogataea haglerorum]|uniref:Uncharacterized protein n=1 Tax=Ogataea haglerorum TaxID=1937702 RepID=A0ABQ7R965_9ASCO|nr:hypothetical protein KL946_005295 [Ogataea haglerorum]